jgi:DNA-binding transcriptional ArsR family regulator
MPAASAREKIPHPAVEALDLATIMRTVGDPLRLEIVRLLADGSEWSCNAIQDRLGMPASTGSYHLRLLREAGVTRTRAAATQRIISLRRDDLERRFPGLVGVLTS